MLRKRQFGSSVAPVALFILGVSLLKPSIRKKDTLIIKALMGNLGPYVSTKLVPLDLEP